MKREDVSEVSRLLCRCYKWLCDVEGFAKEYADFLVSKRGSVETIKNESEDQRYFVAFENNAIVGMAAVKENEITRLYVDPKWHRKGIGTKLFNAAEEFIRKSGYGDVILGVLGSFAVRFYETMGMTISGLKKRPTGIAGNTEVILMKKELNFKQST